MANKPCLDCGAISTGTRCPTHTRAADRARGSRQQRGYDADWDAIRPLILTRDNWTCHYCGRWANTVDHKIPLSQGGPRLDPANLVAACRQCNSGKGGR